MQIYLFLIDLRGWGNKTPTLHTVNNLAYFQEYLYNYTIVIIVTSYYKISIYLMSMKLVLSK